MAALHRAIVNSASLQATDHGCCASQLKQTVPLPRRLMPRHCRTTGHCLKTDTVLLTPGPPTGLMTSMKSLDLESTNSPLIRFFTVGCSSQGVGQGQAVALLLTQGIRMKGHACCVCHSRL